MKKIVLCFTALLWVASLPAQKSYEWKEQPGTYPYKYVTNDPLGARYYTLANGLTVITSVNKREPRLQTVIATKAGSKTDPAKHTGLAHYLEHLLFKGTDRYGSANWAKEKPLLDRIDGLYEKYNETTDAALRKKIYHEIDSVSGVAAQFAIANEYDKMMSAIGAKGTNAFTSFEVTAYINDIPSNRLDQWIKVERERFRNPVFRIFHTELEAVYEEKNISLDDDNEKVFEALLAALFKNHTYGLQTTIGTVEHLKNPSLKEIRKYYQTYYVPNNMCVILCGDFNPDEAVKKVDAAFSYMQPKPVADYTYTPEEDLKKPVEITVYGKEAEYLTFAYRFPGASDAGTDLLQTVADLLSNGKAGLLDGLVTRREALSVSADAYILKDYSVLFFSGTPKEGQSLEALKALILAEVEKLKKGEFDENLLKAIVNNRKLGEIKGAEKNAGRAFGLLDAFMVGRDRVSVLKGVEAAGRFSKKQIADYAQKYLSASPVIVYKRQGDDNSTGKVEKPEITPVALNSDKESPFVKEFMAMKPAELKVPFPDFKKEIVRGNIGHNELLCVKNTQNELFNLYFVAPVGYKYNAALRVLESYFGYAGIRGFTAEAYDKELYKLASSVSFSVREDETYIGVSGLNENFSASYRLLMDKLNGLQMDEAILASVKEIILKERADAKANPNAILSRLNSFGYYEGKNPANDVVPDEVLKSLRTDDLKNLLHTLTESAYRILYYGPASYPDVESVIAGSRPMTLSPVPAPTPVKMKDYTLRKPGESQVILVNYPKVQMDILWMNNGADFKAELLPIQALYNEYFGAEVFREIRESKALAYSTYSVYSTPAYARLPFRCYAYIGCQADKLDQALKAMDELLKTMPKSEGNFTAAKASLRNSINTSAITGMDILWEFLRSEKLGLTVPVKQYVSERLDPLTLTDVANFHAKYISGVPRTVIIFGDLEKLDRETIKNSEKLQKIPVELDEVFGY